MKTVPKPSAIVFAAFLGTIAGACGAEDQSRGYNVTVQTPVEPGQPYTLASGVDSNHAIHYIAVSGDYLFFATRWQGVYRLPKYGGDLQVVESDANANTYGLASNGTDVFWIHGTDGDDELRRRSTSGGEIVTMRDNDFSTMSISSSPNLFADERHVFMLSEAGVDALSLDGSDHRALMAWPVSPGAPDATYFSEWVVTYPDIYATLTGPGCSSSAPATSSPCGLLRFDIETGASVPLSGPSPFLQGGTVEAADETSLFGFSADHIVRIAKSDMAETTVYTPVVGENIVNFYLLADASDLYFESITPDGWKLRSVPKAGGAARDVGWGPELMGGVWGMTQDDGFVFVLTGTRMDSGVNSVLAFPKWPVAPVGASP